ncbi:MAG: flippase-like domain-containing protein [Solobacterium sp.]|nr:flippase-like domain-containing protein [Solobacterium sp.]
MKQIRKLFSNYVFNGLLGLFLSGLIVYLIIHENPSEIFERLIHADRGWLFFIVVLVVANRVLSGAAITLECHLSRPSYAFYQGVENAFVGGLFNEITPSASGGQFAQIYLFKKQGVSVSESAGILWMNFIIYQTTMVIVTAVLLVVKLPFFLRHYSHFFLIVPFGFLVNAAVILGLFALVKFPKYYSWLSTAGIHLGHKLHLIQNEAHAVELLNGQLERFQAEIAILSSHRRMAFTVAAIHFLRLVLYFSVPYFCACALRISCPSSMLLDMITLSSFVSMVNAFVPLPGASGGTEASFLLMFGTILSRQAVRPVMLVWRFMTYYFDMCLGAIIFLIAKNRRTKAEV